MTVSKDLSGRNAIVTEGASGLGRAIANTHLTCRYKLRQILVFRLQQSTGALVPNLSLLATMSLSSHTLVQHFM